MALLNIFSNPKVSAVRGGIFEKKKSAKAEVPQICPRMPCSVELAEIQNCIINKPPHLGLLFSHLHLSWSHNIRPRLQKFCHTTSSSDSPLSVCTAWSNPPTGIQSRSALLLSCPACLRIPLGTPAVQDLRGTAGTIIMMLMLFIIINF